MEVDSPSESDYEEIAKVKAEILKKQQDVKELEALAADNPRHRGRPRLGIINGQAPAVKVIESDLRRLAN